VFGFGLGAASGVKGRTALDFGGCTRATECAGPQRRIRRPGPGGTIKTIFGKTIVLTTDGPATRVTIQVQDDARPASHRARREGSEDMLLPLQLTDLQTGDRIFGAPASSRTMQIAAWRLSVIAMKSADNRRKTRPTSAPREVGRSTEWGGLVKEIGRRLASTIKISTNDPRGAGQGCYRPRFRRQTILRRYAPNSVKF